MDDRLTPETRDAIGNDIVEDALRFTRPVEKPTVIILAGQPGAGKSRLRAQALDELGGQDQVVVVEVDEMRDHHPGYLEFKQANDRTAADRVQEEASAWADRLVEAAGQNHRNLIIDGTLKNERNAIALCERLSAQGYRVDVRALAVAKEDSWLRVHYRYEFEKAETGHGRWVPSHLHDAAHDGMLRSLDAIESAKAADVVSVYRSDADGLPNRFYENARCRQMGGAGAAQAVRHERDRPRTTAELRHRADLSAEVMEMTKRRDPGLTEPESRDARNLAERAFKASPTHRKRMERSPSFDEKSR